MKTLKCVFFAIFLCFTLVACKAANPESPSVSSTPDSTSETTLPAATDEVEVNVAFKEITVVDNEFITLKITDVVSNNPQDYTVNVSLKNKSAASTYTISLDSVSINGVYDGFGSLNIPRGTVRPGNILQSSIRISDIFPEDIGEYTDISLSFLVRDDHNMAADPIAEKIFHIYPQGESAATQYHRQSNPSDKVLIDNDAVTVTYIGHRIDEYGYYIADLYIENKTDSAIALYAEDVSVNGIMLDPVFLTKYPSGIAGYSKIQWSKSAFSKNSITEVEEIVMKLTINYNLVNGKYTENITEEITFAP